MFEIKRSELIGAYASSMGATSAEALIEGKIREAHLEEKETYTREEIARLCGELMRGGGLIRILAQNFLVQLEYVAREELEELVQERTRELTETNEELNRSKQHFQTLFSAMVDPVVIIDSEGVFVEATDNVEEVTGFAKEELLGRSFLKIGIVTEESKAMISENLAKRRAGVNVAPCEVEVLTKDGRKLSFEVNAAQITYMEQPADMLIFRDITERKKAEEQLNMFKTFADTSNQGMGWANIDGNIVYINSALTELFGEKDQKVPLGKNVATYYPEDEQQRLREEIFPCVVKEGAWSGELMIRQTSGKLIPTHDSLFLIRNEASEPTFIGNIVTDITEHRKAEESLRSLSAVVKQSSEGMAIANLDGILTFANDAWCKMHGYKSSKKLLGKNLAIFHNKEQLENEVKTFNEKVRELAAYKDVIYVLRLLLIDRTEYAIVKYLRKSND